MPSHLKMKYRQPGQATTEDLKRRVGLIIKIDLSFWFKDLRHELEEKERAAAREKRAGKEAMGGWRILLHLLIGRF